MNFPGYPDDSYIDRITKILYRYPKIVALIGLKYPESVIHSASFVSSIKYAVRRPILLAFFVRILLKLLVF